MPKNEVCNDCYQVPCEMRNKPFFLSEIAGDEQTATPRACFFHCCGIGIMSALNVLHDNKQATEIIEFESDHKPFLDTGMIKGRYVSPNNTSDGLEKGDVVVFLGSQRLKLTNIYKYRPPRGE